MTRAQAAIGQFVGYAVAAVLLALFFRNTNWRQIASGLQTAEWTVIGLAIAVRLASLLVSAARWQAMLRPAGDVPLRGAAMVTMMGVTASAVVPMPAAEFVRPYLMSRRYRIALPATLATTMAEWMLDAFAIMALFLPALAWHRESAGAALVAPAVTLFGLALAAMAVLPRLVTRASGACRWRRLGDALRACESGFDALRRPSGLARVIGYSLLIAVLTAVSAWLTLRAFETPIPFAGAFLLLGLVTVAGMIPTPAAIGGFHAACQLGLVTLFHMQRAATLLPVLILHAVLYLPAALLGGVGFLLAAHQRRSGA